MRLRAGLSVIAWVFGLLAVAGIARAGLPGDVDADCDVDVADAVKLERALAGYVVLTDEEAANANLAPIGGTKDSVVDVGDLVTVKRIVVRDVEPAATLTRPTIDDTFDDETTSNPILVKGVAPVGSTVLLYINGAGHPYSDTADANGVFEFSAASGNGMIPLVDGDNEITVVARTADGSSQSCSSEPRETEYQPPPITNPLDDFLIDATTVWTPGRFGNQPVVINQNVVVQDGKTLFIQPGVILKFAANKTLQVDPGGKLQILGTPDQKVVLGLKDGLTCNSSTYWGGIDIRSSPGPRNLIEYAVIDCVYYGLSLGFGLGSQGSVTFRFSEVKRWVNTAVSLGANTTAANIRDSVFVDGQGDYGISSASAGSQNLPTGTELIQFERNVVRAKNTGIYLTKTPDTLKGNDVRLARRAGIGIHIPGSPLPGSPPFRIEENTITNNCNGIELNRQNSMAVPDVERNNIYDNEYCLGGCTAETTKTCTNYTTYLAGILGCGTPPPPPEQPALDATDNWWGTTDLADIEGKIFGYCTQAAPIDFVPFLDAPFDQGGVSVGAAIQGEIHNDNKPAAGPDWIVLGTATVPDNLTLTISDAQAQNIKFGSDAQLIVEGTLVVQNTTAADVVFTSLPPSGTPAAPGDWQGILVRAGGSATISDAIVEYAGTALTVTGAGSSLELTGSLVRNFGTKGIQIENDATADIHDNRNAGSTLGIFANAGKDGIVVKDVDLSGVEVKIDNNEIKNGGAGVRIENSSPKLRGNLIKVNSWGVYISGPGSALISSKTDAPTLPGNEITGNCRGIYVYAPTSQPQPIVRENKIHTNQACSAWGSYNFYIDAYGAGPVLALDAENNWWGSNVPATIAALIVDRTDVAALPTVDFVPYYDSSAMTTLGGTNLLLGVFASDPENPNDVLAPGNYTAAGTLIVDSDDIWRIGPGVTITFDDSSYDLVVNGSLRIAGASGSGVTLRPPSGGTWGGIVASGAAAAGEPKLDVQFATIQNALFSIQVSDTTGGVSIADSTIQNFGVGISLQGVNPTAGASIARTVFDDASSGGTGVSAVNSKVVIADDNWIRNLGVGILVAGSSTPTIGTIATSPNLIEDFSQYGILFTGVNGGSIVNNHIENNVGTSPRVGTGILLDASSPVLRNNRIRYTDTGILVLGDSAPVIGEVSPTQPPHNTITSNRVGIRLEGNPAALASAQPTATIQRNNLAGNDQVDLEVVQYPTGIDLTIDARENWWGETTEGTIRSRIRLDTTSPVGVEFSNFLSGVDGMAPSSAPNLFSTVITQVLRNLPAIAPTLPSATPLQVSTLILGTGSDITFDIYEEDDDARANLIHRETRTGISGPQTFTWNGTRSQAPGAGDFVDNEAYIYVLSAAGGLGSYDPPRLPTGAAANGVGASAESYNVFRNDFMKTVFDMVTAPGRVTLQMLQAANGAVIRNLFTDVVFPQRDDQYFVYAGRNETQGYGLESHAQASRYFYVTVPKDLRPNHVIVEQVRPRVQPPDYDPTAAVPRIEVKSDPYLVINSYDQVSTIAYRLDQTARVTLQILDASMSAVGPPLVSSALQQPGTTYTYQWSGVDALTAGGQYDLVDGNYTFAITATHPTQISGATPLVTTYRGVIQVMQ